MRKIAVVVTARPSYARIKSVLRAIQENPRLELCLILAASALLDRYGNVAEVIRADGFEPEAEVYMVLEGGSPVVTAKTLGVGVMELANLFDQLEPDCVVSVADRYETLATAIAGAYLNIPVAHVQGGEITGSIDEKVRHAVTKLADLHFVANVSAFDRLRQMGESAVWLTGCPSIDLAAWVCEHWTDAWLIESLGAECARGTGAEINRVEPYIIAMQHPVSYEWEEAGAQTWALLEAVHRSKLQCFWFWPNIDAGADLSSKAIRLFREQHDGRHRIRFLRNMPPETFLSLLRGAEAIVGNSSVAIREGAFLGTPAVNIGSRQRGRGCAANVLHVVDYACDAIQAAINAQVGRAYHSSRLYGDGTAGLRIAAHLATQPLTTEKLFGL